MASERKSERSLNLDELTKKLEAVHLPLAWNEAKKWFDDNLGEDLTLRLKVLSNILATQKPFRYDEALKAKEIEEFHCLQGDVISSAVGNVPEPISPFEDDKVYYYALVPASCSANRYKQVLTARLIPITATDKDKAFVLKQALLFNTHKYFYLPPLEDQEEEIIGNLAHFEEVSYISADDLKHAQRICSLSEIGWRLFNAFLTYHFTRPSDDETVIRGGSTDAEISIEVPE